MSPPRISPHPVNTVGTAAQPAAASTLLHARCHLLAGTTHPPHTFERGEVTISCPGHRNPGDVYVTTMSTQRRGGRRAAR